MSLQFRILSFILFVSFFSYSQRPDLKKVTISGQVTDQLSSQPLEYATIVFQSTRRPDMVTGGITDGSGNFSIEIIAGTYDVRVEFISFKTVEFKGRNFQQDTNLGVIALSEESTMLEGVELRAERTSVELKLDKKVYNVGQDLMVKGGTVSDVLDNIPSVSVDTEGNVSLRGNENVRILIDGRPSGLAAINIAEALKLLPADSIEKVEVITNPSARYDAEGGGGILNIILKKGKNQGVNGVVIANTGIPDNHGVSVNLNYKTEKFNLFTTTGYNYRNNPGRGLMDAEYFNPDGTTRNFIDERRKTDRYNEGFNSNFGFEWYLDDSTTWTNAISMSRGVGDSEEDVNFFNYDANRNFQFLRNRFSDENNKRKNLEYSSNLLKKFKREGHQLFIDVSFSQNSRSSDSEIIDQILNSTIDPRIETTENYQKSNRQSAQLDYVLPFGKGFQFETGYKGDFLKSISDFNVESDDFGGNPFFNNIFEYNEFVNAFYSQLGWKKNKFSYLAGLRWEDSNIDVNFLSTDEFNKKRYNNFFPSAFIAYEISDESSISLSYSRRISRPRGRFLNPFNGIASNINIFQGNPDLDPAMTDAFDLGYLKRWKKLTLNTSMYYRVTNDVFQFVRRESGAVIDDIPVIIASPFNLATAYDFGFEFTLNYSPFKWWRLNGNFNFFRNETQGDFSYVSIISGETITQNFDNVAYSWFARINSKVTLPGKIDWQTNATYNAPQTNAQGRSLGIFAMNLAFSKDVLKDKGTIAFNVSDVFNSRKRIFETELPNVNSYNEMQWRVRSATLSFTYRFNRSNNDRERERQRRPRENGDDGDFPMG
jgi:outer membrane receptor for ferrienterochelin and colicins